jgi:hypothetical protein
VYVGKGGWKMVAKMKERKKESFELVQAVGQKTVSLGP